MAMSKRGNSARPAYAALPKLPDYARAALWRGWVDAQTAPDAWPAFYDRMSESQQLLYEFGRLQALNVIAAGLPVPAWCGAVETALPMHVFSQRAVEIAGDPWPRGRHA
jgi:hypothetical protein